MTLREVCGLTTEEIARAFLTTPSAIAQRIVRAKAKIRDAGIPYQVPARARPADRLDSVLQVVYLVFNEGYSASSGDSLTRADLSAEAIRLGRFLARVAGRTRHPWAARPHAAARVATCGANAPRTERSILLDDQDRSLWNRDQIAEGSALVERALASRRFGPYTLQAAIAAVHAEAPTAADTDWAQIVGLYDVLLRAEPSPIVELNRAAAVAMRDGPAAGTRPRRGDPRARRPRRLLPGARRACRPLPPAGTLGGGARLLRARPWSDSPDAGAPVPGATVAGIERVEQQEVGLYGKSLDLTW